MTEQTELLQRISEETAANSVKIDSFGHSLGRIEKAVLGNGAIGLKDQVARHSANWRIFVILGALLTAGGTVVGVVAIATK